MKSRAIMKSICHHFSMTGVHNISRFLFGHINVFSHTLSSNHAMSFLILQLLIKMTCVSGIEDINYVYLSTLNNKVCSSLSRSFVITAKSRIDCSQLCTQYTGCVSFFYSASSNTCTGCTHIFKDASCGLDNANGNAYYHTQVEEVAVEDCLTIKQTYPLAGSGSYIVTLSSGRSIYVNCDMDTEGGGWTVFQYRYTGALDFYRGFQDFTDGFGDTNSEFWLGLQNIHEMAPPDVSSELYLFLDDGSGSTRVERASTFSVGDYPCFEVTLTGGGSDLTYNNGAQFSTYDYGPKTYCATQRQSGWWHHGCTWINPNGNYVTPGSSDGWSGVVHVPWKGFNSMEVTKIMFRRN